LTLLATNGGIADMPLLLIVTLFTVLFAFSFFFSGTETAMFSLRKADRKNLERGNATAKRVTSLLKNRIALITTILIGNETANVVVASLGASLVVAKGYPPWLNIVLLTPALVLFSEITPKVVALHYNTIWVRWAVWPLTLFSFVVTPLRVVVSFIVTTLARGFAVTSGHEETGLKEMEIRDLIDRGAESGNVEAVERELIEAVFEFDELTVGRLMTPRPDIFAVPLNIRWNNLLARCSEAGFSRIPIYGRNTDDILGVLLLKDLLKIQKAPPAGPRQLRSLILSPIFVPVSKKADDMLTQFLEKKIHMAFVVDEHGTLLGIVTLDDLLDELVGDIVEEEETSEIERLTSGLYTAKAWMDLEDFQEETGIEVPSGDYHTLGGFVFHQLGRLPRKGDTLTLDGHEFMVGKVQGRRITEVHVRLQDNLPPSQKVTG